MVVVEIVHKADEGGYWAEVPGLPGCLTQGETIIELMAYVGDAISLWHSPGPDVDQDASQPTDLPPLGI